MSSRAYVDKPMNEVTDEDILKEYFKLMNPKGIMIDSYAKNKKGVYKFIGIRTISWKTVKEFIDRNLC